MKHTKKRAILSAIAMLIVSTIALSSATYAWFSAGTEVNVDAISATITNNDGSLLISADNSSWGIRLSSAQLTAQTTNIMPDDFTTPGVFVPVSTTWGTSPQVIAGSMNSDHLFSAGGAATNNYIKFTVYIKSTAATPVTITPTFDSTLPFAYFGIIDSDENPLMAKAVDSYYPISGGAVTCLDTSGNDIVDILDAVTGTDPFSASDIGTEQSATAPQSISMTLAAGVSQSFTVYCWAEGQDLDCYTGAGTSNVSIALQCIKG